jgi:hypothetical protein
VPAKRPETQQPFLPLLVIPPDALFTMKSLRETLGIRVSLRYEIRKGRLKVYKVCGRYFTTGAEVLAWIRRAPAFGYVEGNGVQR